MFKIGNVEIKGKVVLGPMAGVTNKVFRKLIKQMGASLVYTEMTSNMGLKYNSQKTLAYANIDQNEGPVALQIFGGEVEDYVAAAKYYDKHSSAQIIDINMGCPVAKVAIKSQAGSSLVKDPQKIRQIIRAVVNAISKPLTVKIRIGWDDDSLTYLEVAKIAEEEGVSAIAVHGRTREQRFSGKANWQAIKEIKDALTIPVIGNGDITSPELAKEMIEKTGVDAVMVARGARQSPWLIKQINDFLTKGTYDPLPKIEVVAKELIKFGQNLINLKGQKVGLLQLRSTTTQWLLSFKSAKGQKAALVQSNTFDEFVQNLDLFVAAHQKMTA